MSWNVRSMARRIAFLVGAIAGVAHGGFAAESVSSRPLTVAAALPNGSRVGAVERDANGEIEAVSPSTPVTSPVLNPRSVRSRSLRGIPANSTVRIAQSEAAAAPGTPYRAPPDPVSVPCPKGAITCVRLEPLGSEHNNLPITFGQVFADGDVPAEAQLQAKLDGKPVPLQLDQPTSFPDGNLRFAVLSTIVPALPEAAVLSIWRADKSAAPAAPASAPPASTSPGAGADPADITADMTVYTPQITHVAFGNRDEQAAGIPFEVGENVTLRIGDEKHTVKIDQTTAGGAFPTLSKLAQVFVGEIGRTSRSFRALQPIAGGNFEHFWLTSKPDGKPFAVKAEYDGKAKISSDIIRPWAAPVAYTGSSKAATQTRTKWLAGPVVTETSLLIPLVTQDGKEQPHLMLRAGVRRYANGRARYEFVLENDWSYVPARQDVEYAIKIRVGDHVVFSADDMNHDMQARWRVVWWRDGDPQVSIIRNIDYMIHSGAIQQLDTTRQVSTAAVNEIAGRIVAAGVGPLQTSIIQTGMSTAGGRPDLGLFPAWSMAYLFTQQHSIYEAMLDLGNIAGGAPIHYRDKDTDQPLTLDRHPGVALWYGDAARPQDALPTPAFRSMTRWNGLDVAHQPSFVYIPYIMTGEHYYLEELQFWACWDMGHMDPQIRQLAKGLVSPIVEERGQAWFMRSLADAAAMTPDSNPLKPYLQRAVKDNLAALAERTRADPLHNVPGFDAPHQFILSPWSQDFVALVLSHIYELGYKDALEPLDLVSDWVIGRFTQGPYAQHPWLGIQMSMPIRTKPGGDLLRSWAEVYEGQKQLHQNDESWTHFRQEDYAQQGQVVMARAAMAALSSVPIKRREEARRLYQFLRDNGPNSLRQENSYPAWAFAPSPGS